MLGFRPEKPRTVFLNGLNPLTFSFRCSTNKSIRTFQFRRKLNYSTILI